MEKTIVFEVTYLGHCGCGWTDGEGNKVAFEIEMPITWTLDKIVDVIINDVLKWDDKSHLHLFSMGNNDPYDEKGQDKYIDKYDAIDGMFSPGDGEMDITQETKISDLNLKQKNVMTMVFDFGDDQQFKLKVKAFKEQQSGTKLPLIYNVPKYLPRQYPENCDDVKVNRKQMDILEKLFTAEAEGDDPCITKTEKKEFMKEIKENMEIPTSAWYEILETFGTKAKTLLTEDELNTIMPLWNQFKDVIETGHNI
jgi:hypothetical protein